MSKLGLLPPPENGPKILIYDIETAPGLAWVWRAYDTNVIEMEQDWYMLSFAYKWYGNKEVGFVSITQDPAFFEDSDDDKFVVERLAELFDTADIIVAHNGDRFDRKKANSRFAQLGINPPSPYQTVDTLKIARREFGNFANNLKELGRIYGLGTKEPHTGFDLWRRCMRGDNKAWKTMEKYNRQDVILLERVYKKLLPWSGMPGKPAAPNMGHWAGAESVCPKCGGRYLVKRGVHRTSVSEFQTVQCKSCKGYSRLRKRVPQVGGKGVRAL